jgi:hypothetical protein
MRVLSTRQPRWVKELPEPKNYLNITFVHGFVKYVSCQVVTFYHPFQAWKLGEVIRRNAARMNDKGTII